MSTWSLTYQPSVFKYYITVTSISQSFYLQGGGKINWHRYGTKLRHSHPMHGRRNRSFRPGGCWTNNLTNKNFYIHIRPIINFREREINKNTSRKMLHCGQLILRKISKYEHDATRCQILRLKCTKFDFRWGFALHPAGGAYSAP